MTIRTLLISGVTSVAALALLGACSQAQDATKAMADTASSAADSAAQTVKDTATNTAKTVASTAKEGVKGMKPLPPGVDIGTAVGGTYVSEKTHAYITFQYMHQGYSRPTLRWNAFEAVLDLKPSMPEDSSLSVTIDTSSIDSGVAAFDDHLASADFFDVENHPKITFTSTQMRQFRTGTGKVTGDLTMKGITKPITLDVTLNKVGENFRSKAPMLGVSGKTTIMRSDWDLGKYAPNVGDQVDIMIEVEFVKSE